MIKHRRLLACAAVALLAATTGCSARRADADAVAIDEAAAAPADELTAEQLLTRASLAVEAIATARVEIDITVVGDAVPGTEHYPSVAQVDMRRRWMYIETDIADGAAVQLRQHAAAGTLTESLQTDLVARTGMPQLWRTYLTDRQRWVHDGEDWETFGSSGEAPTVLVNAWRAIMTDLTQPDVQRRPDGGFYVSGRSDVSLLLGETLISSTQLTPGDKQLHVLANDAIVELWLSANFELERSAFRLESKDFGPDATPGVLASFVFSPMNVTLAAQSPYERFRDALQPSAGEATASPSNE